jgi:hypothetical protein
VGAAEIDESHLSTLFRELTRCSAAKKGQEVKASVLSFQAAVLFIVAGMIWGLEMAISNDHSAMPAHAHLNLLGWVSLFLFGIYYQAIPMARGGKNRVSPGMGVDCRYGDSFSRRRNGSYGTRGRRSGCCNRIDNRFARRFNIRMVGIPRRAHQALYANAHLFGAIEVSTSHAPRRSPGQIHLAGVFRCR